jgi:hypothetical protein
VDAQRPLSVMTNAMTNVGKFTCVTELRTHGRNPSDR